MLILSKKINELITIGHDPIAEVKVLNVRKQRVLLGITASKDIPINPNKIHHKKNRILTSDDNHRIFKIGQSKNRFKVLSHDHENKIEFIDQDTEHTFKVSAAKLVKQQRFIRALAPEDACLVGYIAAQEEEKR